MANGYATRQREGQGFGYCYQLKCFQIQESCQVVNVATVSPVSVLPSEGRLSFPTSYYCTVTDSLNKVPKWKFFPNSTTTVTCHVAVPISTRSSVSIIIWPKRLGSPRLPLQSPHIVSGSLHIFGEAPRRGSEMMQRAFSRTVRNLSF